MAKTPSYSLLVKDAIGQALNVSAVKTSQDREERIGDYNQALMEIYNILGYIDTEAYLEISSTLSASMYGFPKCGYVDLASIINWDKVIEIEIFQAISPSNTPPLDNGEKVDYSTFSSHRNFGVAIDPYDESIIYTIVGDKIYFLIGESLDYQFNTISFKVIYRRQPTLMTYMYWTSAKVDLPDKYWSLLVNRIASLVEFRAGIFDKSLAMVKMTYEQLLTTIDPVIKASLMKSLETPVGAIQ